MNKLISLIKQNKKSFILSVVIDFIFSIVFIISFYMIVTKVFDILLRMSTMLDTISDYDALQSISQSVEFFSLYNSLLKWLVILALSLYVIWVVFQSLSFYLGLKLFRKLKFWDYFKKFCVYSLFYYLIIVGTFILAVYLSILNARLPIPIFPQIVINFIVGIIILITLYFGAITLTAISKYKIVKGCQKTMQIGLKKFKKVAVYFLISVLLLVFAVFVLYLLFKVNIFLLYAGFILLFIPTITFLRISYFYYLQKLL